MNAKSVPEDCDPRRRDKDVRISPVQFLYDREIGTHNAKQGIVINDDKEYWFGRLGDEMVHIDFEEKFLVQSFWFNKGTMLLLNAK